MTQNSPMVNEMRTDINYPNLRKPTFKAMHKGFSWSENVSDYEGMNRQ